MPARDCTRQAIRTGAKADDGMGGHTVIGSRRRGRVDPYRHLRERAIFTGALFVFLIIGIVLVGDLAAQWWVLLVPIALLVGPVLAVRRGSDRRRDGDRRNPPWG